MVKAEPKLMQHFLRKEHNIHFKLKKNSKPKHGEFERLIRYGDKT